MDDVDVRESPLLAAMKEEAPIDEIKAILKENPDLVRKRTISGHLPLHLVFLDTDPASSAYALDLARCFLEAWPEGAREWTKKDPSLPLHGACQCFTSEEDEDDSDTAENKAEMVRILVKAWPESVRERDWLGRSPLQHALEKRQPLASFQAIVEAWPQAVQEAYRGGAFLLHDAIEYGAPVDVVQFLVKQHPDSVHAVESSGQVALHKIGKHTKAEAVRFLLDAWVEAAQQRDRFGRLPLHCAADVYVFFDDLVENVEILRLLVDRYPKALQVQDDDGSIPLHKAAGSNIGPEGVQFLIDQWPESVRTRNKKGEIPLHLAWRLEVQSILPFVQIWPESVGERFSDGTTPLHKVMDDRIKVELFVNVYPESIRIASIDGMLPIHYAIVSETRLAVDSHGMRTVMHFLHQRFPQSLLAPTTEGNLPLHLAASNLHGDFLDLIRFLVEREPRSLHFLNRHGMVPLQCACASGAKLPIVQFLLGVAPDMIEIRCRDGASLLHLAVASPYPSKQGVQHLLRLRPQLIHEPNLAGSLPVHLAVVSKSKGRMDLVRTLVDALPRSLLLGDFRGATPLHAAVARSDADLAMVEYLVEQEPRSLQRKEADGLLPMHVAAAHDAPLDVLFALISGWPQAVYGGSDPSANPPPPFRPYKRPRRAPSGQEAAM